MGLAMTRQTPQDLQLRYEICPPAKMTGDLRRAWESLRADNPALYSPYFHFDYTAITASLRSDVRIIIAFDGETPLAFLPVQGTKFARPVGAPMTDYHGVICAAGTPVDIEAMLSAAGIGAYHYDALTQNAAMSPPETTPCSVINLSAGGPTWRAGQDGSYRRHLKSLRRRIRNSDSEHGEVRAALKTTDKDVFDTVIAWKRAQYARTGKYDVLSADWTRGLLSGLLARPDEDLRIDMHALYFGEKLAAVDMGLTDGRTYHSWITAYDPDLRNYSPGMQLLEQIIEGAQDCSYSTLDLGPGLDGYKRHYADETFAPVSSGFIAAGGPAAALSRLYGAAEAAAERAPIGGLSRLPGKIRRRYSMISACDPTFSGRAKAMVSAVTDSGRHDTSGD